MHVEELNNALYMDSEDRKVSNHSPYLHNTELFSCYVDTLQEDFFVESETLNEVLQWMYVRSFFDILKCAEKQRTYRIKITIS